MIGQLEARRAPDGPKTRGHPFRGAGCTTSATAADDGWIRSPASLFGYALEAGYTLTPVRGVPPAGDDLGMRPRFMGPLRRNACPLARGQRRKPPMS
ncbi:hypothetical protein BOG92_002160 [Streptomyces sp. WAC00263]|nr:hypothetical protein BOG92_002160 [Streptomyces sp. WAC00263]